MIWARRRNIRKLSNSVDIEANGIKAVQEHLEVDFDGGLARINAYVCDAAHGYASVPNGTRHVQAADVLGGIGDQSNYGTCPHTLNEEQRRCEDHHHSYYDEKAKLRVALLDSHLVTLPDKRILRATNA
jgi:hypothetical protein